MIRSQIPGFITARKRQVYTKGKLARNIMCALCRTVFMLVLQQPLRRNYLKELKNALML